MEGFHKRYMNSNQGYRYWANMASGMDIDMIVPQHGRALVGGGARVHSLDRRPAVRYQPDEPGE